MATAPLWVALLFGIQLVSAGPIDQVQPSTINPALGNFDWQSAPARYGDHAAVESGWITLASPHRSAGRTLSHEGAPNWVHATAGHALPGGGDFVLAVRTLLDAARYGRDSFHSTAVPPPTR
jgi:hypothetical protein